MDFTTRVLNTPYNKSDIHGALRMPVYDTAAFEYPDAESLEAAFLNRKPGHVYSRLTNPTVEHLENIIKEVTGALGVISFSSGMAAISNTFFALVQPGDNIITTKHLFGNTYSLFHKTLKSFGIKFRFADLTDLTSVKGAIDKHTRAIFLETITNPMLEVADAGALSEIARENKILLIADTTLTPLYLFDSKKHHVDIEIISGTKYISGGGTSTGGIVIDYGTYDWSHSEKLSNDAKKYGHFTFIAKLRKEVHRNLGACLSPHNAYLQTLGLETFALRAERSCANSLEIAEWLEKHPKVGKVNYPGLKSSAYYNISQKQFGKYAGAIITLDLASKEECFLFLNNLKIIRRATNLNDNKTLALHPASTIFCEYTPEELVQLGVSENTIRMAIGIESARDLIDDINQALNKID
ncbi:MAG: O-acetylhomoserine aminocarboxypropyltransferase/cysteine synthase [Chlorobi bacterium]|nr:O-acetylhomoserine aminocarboxypropyltransferase/cysteine synthase [Chlorobiota bacterium]